MVKRLSNGTPLVNIGVIGVGGAGCNAVNMMIDEIEKARSRNEVSEFEDITIIVANTDSQDLDNSKAEHKIQLGTDITKGWGAGGRPQVGGNAAEESQVEIAKFIEGFDMLFVTAGMGGGTGTGAAPVIASIAKKSNILTVGIVTMPLDFEGSNKSKLAHEGLENLKKNVDTLVVIPNQKLVDIAEVGADAKEMFLKPTTVLIDAVKNISSTVSSKSFINVDYADVKSIMTDMGLATIGSGSATGENATMNAVTEALKNPLLSDVSISGARKALLHMRGRIPMKELVEASSFVEKQLGEGAIFRWGFSDKAEDDRVQVLIVAEAFMNNSKTVSPAKTKVTEEQKTLFDMEQSKTVYDASKKSSILKSVKNINQNIEKEEQKSVAAVSEPIVFVKDSDSSFAVSDYDNSVDFSFDTDDGTIPSYLRKKKKAVSSHVTSKNSQNEFEIEFMLEPEMAKKK